MKKVLKQDASVCELNVCLAHLTPGVMDYCILLLELLITFLLFKVYINRVALELKIGICMWKAWGEGRNQGRPSLVEKWTLIEMRTEVLGRGVH